MSREPQPQGEDAPKSPVHRSPVGLDPHQAEALREYNRHAWNCAAAQGGRWSQPLKDVQVQAIKQHQSFDLSLTPTSPVPIDWLPASWRGLKVLGLAAAGGQQGPGMAAAGAEVTVYDLAEEQLALDEQVAKTHHLALTTVQGDAASMPALADQAFDLIVHPVSNCFFPDLRPVWQECARVLRPGGALLAGIMNPMGYQFAWDQPPGEAPRLKYPQPYSDLQSLDAQEQERFLHQDQPVEYGHSLEDQLGGLLRAGFVLTHFQADRWTPPEPKDAFFPAFFLFRAERRL